MVETTAATSDVQPNRPDMALPEALPAAEIDRLTDDIIGALKSVYDPEIPSDIYELGLIYRIDIDDNCFVTVDMTLTAPGCPVAGEMPGWVEIGGRGRRRGVGGQGQHGLRSAMGPEPHVGRGAHRARHVVSGSHVPWRQRRSIATLTVHFVAGP